MAVLQMCTFTKITNHNREVGGGSMTTLLNGYGKEISTQERINRIQSNRDRQRKEQLTGASTSPKLTDSASKNEMQEPALNIGKHDPHQKHY
jgi:hypothetical protein